MNTRDGTSMSKTNQPPLSIGKANQRAIATTTSDMALEMTWSIGRLPFPAYKEVLAIELPWTAQIGYYPMLCPTAGGISQAPGTLSRNSTGTYENVHGMPIHWVTVPTFSA